jgi:hypothetical protein
VTTASRDLIMGTVPRAWLILARPVHRHDSRLPKQAAQTIRCLTFVAARRRVEGKALVHGV